MAKFYSFKNGVKIDDHTINEWLDDCRKAIMSGEKFWNICSGDTKVIAFAYDSSWTFYVCNSDDVATINFYAYDKKEMVEHSFNYRRPIPVENISEKNL